MTRSSLSFWLIAAFLSGCKGCNGKNTDDSGGIDLSKIDDDNDGYTADVDCDDDNADVNPDATEVCNGIDDDCDDAIDDEDPGLDTSTQDTWYTDIDDDGYGDDDTAEDACSSPTENSVILGGDCDDRDSDINPGELEVCDGIDNNCDGDVDLNAADGFTVYEDGDGDDYGDDGSTLVVCDDTEGYADIGGDCDDSDHNVNPGEAEACFNDIDDNCDGEVDDSCPVEMCGDIDVDTGWDYEPFGYYVSCDIAVNAELTIAPATIVYFAPNVGMTVGGESGGALIIDAADSPVTFTSGVSIIYPEVSPSGGDWTGLTFGSTADTYTTVLEGLSVWYGGGDDGDGNVVMDGVDLSFAKGEICGSGSDGLVAEGGAAPTVTNTTICENAGRGLYADDDSGPGLLDGNTFQNNEQYPVSVLARYGDVIEGSNSFSDHDPAFAYIELRGDTVTSDITLAAQDYPYAMTSDVLVYDSGAPLLTLEDGVTVAFAYEAGLQIGSTTTPGDWTVAGSGSGVLMTAMDSSRGWDGVTVQQGSDLVTIEGLTLEYGGNNGKGGLYLVNGSAGLQVAIDGSTLSHSYSNGLYVGASVEPLITGSTFSDNDDYGVYVYDGTSGEGGLYIADSGASFAGNTLTGNSVSITVPASYADQLDDSSSYSGNASDYVEVTGGTVGRTGTWQKLDADYWVLGDVSVEDTDSPILTIDPGTTLYMDPDTAFTVGDSKAGGMVTKGSSASPITLTSVEDTPGAGDWDGLTIGKSALSSTSLEGLVVQYGGGNGYGGIYIYASSPALSDCEVSYSSTDGVYVAGKTGSTTEPDISSCTLQDNEENGLYVATSGGLGTFEANTMTANGAYPASVYIDYLAALDSESAYTGNADDRVEVLGTKLNENAIWQELDAPYLVGSSVTISADLTIKGGAEMEFTGASSGLNVGSISSGSITVSGTSSKHVTMTSGEDTASSGDWSGLKVSQYCGTSTIKYLDVTYADIGITMDCSKSNSVANSSFKTSETYDIKCTSRATSTSWSSVTYSTSSGCTP